MPAADCPVGELCQLPVDIVLKSSDNVLIGAHKANLEQWSEGFPKAESVVEDDDPVELPENAETLKLLMTCMHNHQFPDLSELAPYKLFDLARAAEKYEVNAAKAACNGHIVWQASKYPAESLSFAVRFDYPKIADAAAPHTLTETMSRMRMGQRLDDRAMYAWLRYKAAYMEVFDIILSEPPIPRPQWGKKKNKLKVDYGCWQRYYEATLADLPRTPAQYLKQIVSKEFSPSIYDQYQGELSSCPFRNPPCQCLQRAYDWKKAVKSALAGVPVFSSLVW